jgi:two-component system CAI-1 autoinducer sensor kinase/phosphatase CqsS
MPLLAATAIACLIGYYFIWRLVYPNDYESLCVRLIAAAICIPALFVRNIPRRAEPWLPIYWTVALAFVLPFVFGYMLAMNAAVAASVGATNLIWPLQNVVALFLLILLVNHGLLATLMWIAATASILVIVFIAVPEPNLSELYRVYLDPMPLYAFVLIVGSLSIRNRDIIEIEKLSAMASVGTTIAHELRTPFLGMRALVEGIEKYLPTLVRTYNLAVSNGLPVERIRLAHIDGLDKSLHRIRSEIDYSNSIVDMLLVNSSERPVRDSEFSIFSAASCVQEAIQRYPFSGEVERSLIETRLDNDFQINAPRVLIVHVLFNLLKNGLYYVRKAGHGEITISLRTSGVHNEMTIEDTGTGIPPQNLKRIFERFFSTTETGHGAGIGLSFCRLVMDGIGGAIRCESEIGVYTRFVLSFPRSHAGE